MKADNESLVAEFGPEAARLAISDTLIYGFGLLPDGTVLRLKTPDIYPIPSSESWFARND